MATQQDILHQIALSDNPYSNTAQLKVAIKLNVTACKVAQIVEQYHGVIDDILMIRMDRRNLNAQLEHCKKPTTAIIEGFQRANERPDGFEFMASDHEGIIAFCTYGMESEETIGKGPNWGANNLQIGDDCRKRVVLTDNVTNEIMTFESYEFAAKFLGMHPLTVATACRMGRPLKRGQFTARYEK